MTRLTFVTCAQSSSDTAQPRIADLAFALDGQGIFAITEARGQLSLWDTTGSALSRIAARDLGSGAVAGPSPEIVALDLPGGRIALATGSGLPSLYPLHDATRFGGGQTRAVNWGVSALDDIEAMPLEEGGIGVYGGFATRDGIAGMRLSDGGALLYSGITSDSAATRLSAVTALASAEIGGGAQLPVRRVRRLGYRPNRAIGRWHR